MANPSEISEMGRANRPKLVELQIARLRNWAQRAIVNAAQQWSERPGRPGPVVSPTSSRDYTKARKWVSDMESYHKIDKEFYSNRMDSFGTLNWVFRSFQDLALECTRTIRLVGHALVDSGAVVRALVHVEETVASEKNVWDAFESRMEYSTDLLPGMANFNIVTLAMIAARFIDVLDDEEHYSDPDFDYARRFGGVAFWRGYTWDEQRH